LTYVSLIDTYGHDQEFQELSDGGRIQWRRPQGFPADLIKVARRKLRYLHAAHVLADLCWRPCARSPAIGSKLSRVIERANTRSA
jgi:plasmid maintenance system killer protein